MDPEQRPGLWSPLERAQLERNHVALEGQRAGSVDLADTTSLPQLMSEPPMSHAGPGSLITLGKVPYGGKGQLGQWRAPLKLRSTG